MPKPDNVISQPKKVELPATLFSDQRRAIYAYTAVASVPKGEQKDYKIAVNDLGANILRGGMVSAMAALERLGGGGKHLMKHLAESGIQGLEGKNETTLAEHIRHLDADQYIFVSREMLRVATWLKRATQTTYKDD